MKNDYSTIAIRKEVREKLTQYCQKNDLLIYAFVERCILEKIETNQYAMKTIIVENDGAKDGSGGT